MPKRVKRKLKLPAEHVEMILSQMLGEIGGAWHHNVHGVSKLPDEIRYNALYIITRTHLMTAFHVLNQIPEDSMTERHRMVWHKTKQFKRCLDSFAASIDDDIKEIERFVENFLPWMKACLALIDHKTSDKEAVAIANA